MEVVNYYSDIDCAIASLIDTSALLDSQLSNYKSTVYITSNGGFNIVFEVIE